MKAVVLETPGKYTYTDVEKPICDAAGILIKVKYCGLCGSDLRTLRSGHKNVRLPAIIGHEVSGIIAEVGEEYSGPYKVGHKLAIAPNVYCGKCNFCMEGRFEYCENIKELAQQWSGGFAEYMAIPDAALALGTIRSVPENLSMKYAGVAEPPSSCINAQEKLNVGLGDDVLIIGAGPIGSIHASLAKIRGAKRVIMADIKQSRLDMAKGFGVDVAINSAETDIVQAVKDITGGKGVDVVITANPVPQTQIQAIEVAQKAGRIAFFGGLPHDNSKVELDSNQIHYKGLFVIGTTGFAPRHYSQSLDLLASGRISGEKLVSHILPLKEFHKGVELAQSGEAMKVVFSIGQE